MSDGMKLGLMLPVFSNDPQRVRSFARSAADMGFDGVFAADHLHVPGSPERPVLEAFAVLATVAAEHPSLTVGTLVARVGLRHPSMLAKMAAATDDLAASGFILGLGTGDEESDDEDASIGISPVADRRALLSETIGALKGLFAGGGWEGGGQTPEIPGPLLPAPSRPGGPPVWIGGAADGLVLMAALRADGWNGWGLDPDRFAMKTAMLREAAGGREVEATWAGSVAVAEDQAGSEALAEARRAKRLPPVWTGSVEQLRSWATRIREGGASWFIAGPVMGDERMSLIARALEGLRS